MPANDFAGAFKQHKGEPLYFGAVRMGQAYVSLKALTRAGVEQWTQREWV